MARMSGGTQPDGQDHDVARIMGGLYGDGIIGLSGAFSPEWADRLREDIEHLFAEARATPGGALSRGPERYYVEVDPERLRGFVDVATHPWFVAVCEEILDPNYRSSRSASTFPFPARPTSRGIATFARPRRRLPAAA
jgi:hypothetical protein